MKLGWGNLAVNIIFGKFTVYFTIFMMENGDGEFIFIMENSIFTDFFRRNYHIIVSSPSALFCSSEPLEM